MLALAVPLASCGGQSAGDRSPSLGQLPLVRGSDVVAQTRQCDSGSNPYCAIELVVVDAKYKSSDALLSGERRHLRSLGWTLADGATGLETGANSPSRRVRVTFATADDDLRGIDLGWIKRPQPITLALSRAIFNRSATLSMMLETGAA